MQLISIRYEPRYLIGLTAKEVETLATAALHHYDARCRELAQQGGVLFGLANRVRLEVPIEAEITRQELDLLCKVSEQSLVPMELARPLRILLSTTGEAPAIRP